TLPGFKSYKREGIVLEGAFSAMVNGSLSVGQIEETVTVTAGSPVVDLQSTQNQSVINRQALDVLPAARTMQGGASLVPGVAFYSQGFTSNMSIHGSLREDQHIYFDGMNIGQNMTQNGPQANNLIPLPTQYFPQGGQSESGGQVAPHSTVRLTWQATQKNKIVWAFYKSQGGTRRFDVGCTATSFNSVSCISPEAAYWLPTPLQYGSQVKWTSPITNRLLLEVGQSLAVPTYKFNYQPDNGPLDIQHVNATTSVRTVASSTAPQDYFRQTWNN